MSLNSAEVGVILRIIPPLLAELPETKAARSLRNSPEQIKTMESIDPQFKQVRVYEDLHIPTHQEMDNICKRAADPPGRCSPAIERGNHPYKEHLKDKSHMENTILLTSPAVLVSQSSILAT